MSAKPTFRYNAVAESTFKIFKTEFINNSIFSTLNELEVWIGYTKLDRKNKLIYGYATLK